MLAFGMQTLFSRIMLASVLLALPLTFVLGNRFGAVGAAVAVDTTSFAIVAAMVIALGRQGLPVWKLAPVPVLPHTSSLHGSES
jgi:O-antigen/teichoic acid export membrane protein